jgi:S1-C subfamily serine protease
MKSLTPTAAYRILAASAVAILRTEGSDGKLVGTGFFVSETGQVLTCNHVVQPYDPQNTTVKYGIVKRKINVGESLDLRQGQISWIIADRIVTNPHLDLAILNIDVASPQNRDIAAQIGLIPPVPLKLSFGTRNIGDAVAWLGMAVLGDMIATPRFFQGFIVSSYVNDLHYSVPGPANTVVTCTASGLRFIEINQLFIPGCSGGPVFSLADKAVVGFVHGYGSWPVGLTPGTLDINNVVLRSGSQEVQGSLRMNAPVVTALSLAIDMTSAEEFLREQGCLRAGGRVPQVRARSLSANLGLFEI